MKKSITPLERAQLESYIDHARALNAASEAFRLLAEEITGDTEMNSHTFDACWNTHKSVDELLRLLGVRVKPPVRKSAKRGHR